MGSFTKEKLLKRIRIKRKNCCWIWPGAIDDGGYGKITFSVSVGKYKTKSTHRISYEIHKGPIPEGLLVCHICDVRRCINPDHLFLGTHKDNMKDCVKKGRFNHYSKLTYKQVKEIRKKYKTGKYTQQELAEHYGVKKSGIGYITLYKNWVPKGAFKKPKPYKGKFSFEKAEEVRAKYKTGKYTQRQLANEYNLCQQTVCDIIRFHIYKYPSSCEEIGLR